MLTVTREKAQPSPFNTGNFLLFIRERKNQLWKSSVFDLFLDFLLGFFVANCNFLQFFYSALGITGKPR